MKRDKIETVPRVITKELVTLTPKEIEIFLHNAQLALCDAVEEVENLYAVKKAVVGLFFTHSNLTPAQIALILVSAAWDIYTGKKAK